MLREDQDQVGPYIRIIEELNNRSWITDDLVFNIDIEKTV